MKKLGFATVAAVALLLGGSAQADVLSEGDRIVGGSLGFSLASWDNAITFGANFEQGIIDDVFPGFNFGAGALAMYADYSGLTYDLSIITLGAQGNLHYDLTEAGFENFQPYGGLLLNYSLVSADQFGSSSLGLGAQVGGRYYFQDNLAASVRWNSSTAGFGGYSVLSAGVDYKF